MKHKTRRKWIQKQPPNREEALQKIDATIRKMADLGIIEIVEEKPGEHAFKIQLTELGCTIGPQVLRARGYHEMADMLEQRIALRGGAQ